MGGDATGLVCSLAALLLQEQKGAPRVPSAPPGLSGLLMQDKSWLLLEA